VHAISPAVDRGGRTGLMGGNSSERWSIHGIKLWVADGVGDGLLELFGTCRGQATRTTAS